MNINIGLNDFHLPIYLSKDCEYYANLCEILDKYDKQIQETDNLKEDCKQKTHSNCDYIKECIKNYYNADVVSAQKRINEILKQYIEDSPFVVADINNNYAFRANAPHKIQPEVHKKSNSNRYDEMMNTELSFYRARISENELHRLDMLHIPFDQRSHISTQRFSMPGVPCLYFSTTSYGAWIEMSMPDAEVFQVSEYKIPLDIKVLNLCYQQYLIDGKSSFINNEIELHDFYNSVEIFPLVIASSFKINEPNRTFKSEYIIPQLIMQVAMSLGIDAVAYLSKRIDDFFAYPKCVNLAVLMPQKDMSSDTRFWKRANEIELTEPCIYSDFLKSDYKNSNLSNNTTFINKFFSEGTNGKVKLIGKILNYSEIPFSKFDEWLHKQEKAQYTK